VLGDVSHDRRTEKGGHPTLLTYGERGTSHLIDGKGKGGKGERGTSHLIDGTEKGGTEKGDIPPYRNRNREGGHPTLSEPYG
jgi:hypothetical protein